MHRDPPKSGPSRNFIAAVVRHSTELVVNLPSVTLVRTGLDDGPRYLVKEKTNAV